MKFLFWYLVGINILTWMVYGIDKWKARNSQWRIPERTLLLLTLAGGSVGAAAGMMVFRHKIRKPKFYIGVPVLFLFHCFVLFLIFEKHV